jgi:Tfp pilus assembly protein PilX
MLLINSFFTRLGRSSERGSALIAVLGVMVVGLIFTTIITTSVLSAYGVSSSTRAAVQSHAAADAGIAAARAGLYVSGNCSAQPTPGTYSATGTLAYTATIQFDAGSGWQNGCPTSSTSRIRIVSSGKPQAPGISGSTSGNTRKVEAIYNWVVPGPRPSGTSIYLYGGGQVEANANFDMSESAGLVIQNGNLLCDKNNAVFNGDVTVGGASPNGNLTFSQNCTVNGNVVVQNTASLGSGKIVGKLMAKTITPTNPSLAVVSGGYTLSSTPPAAVPWVDLPYQPSDWRDSTGAQFEVRTAPGVAPSGIPCSLTNGNLGGTTLGKPVILDMRACVGGPTAGNNTTVSLTSDVVIFANQFDFSSTNSLTFTSSSSAIHRLWFITPDNTNDHQPTCNRTPPATDATHQDDFNAKNSLSASDVISTTNAIQAMLYTPCALISKNNLTWNGQIYTGNYTTIVNNPTYTFDQVGVAGYDLSTGAVIPTLTSPQPGALISNRDLAG